MVKKKFSAFGKGKKTRKKAAQIYFFFPKISQKNEKKLYLI